LKQSFFFCVSWKSRATAREKPVKTANTVASVLDINYRTSLAVV